MARCLFSLFLVFGDHCPTLASDHCFIFGDHRFVHCLVLGRIRLGQSCPVVWFAPFNQLGPFMRIVMHQLVRKPPKALVVFLMHIGKDLKNAATRIPVSPNGTVQLVWAILGSYFGGHPALGPKVVIDLVVFTIHPDRDIKIDYLQAVGISKAKIRWIDVEVSDVAVVEECETLCQVMAQVDKPATQYTTTKLQLLEDGSQLWEHNKGVYS